jgi:glutathione S-transferase
MITVHHLNESRSQRILWLLEELGFGYEIVSHARDPMTRLAPAALKAIHPLGKSPVIVDDGEVVAESGAIIEHLVDKAGGALRPAAGTPAFEAYRHWLHFAEGSAMLPLMLALYTGFLGDAAAPLKPRIDSEIDNHLSYMDAALEGQACFAGDDFTACDVQMTFVVEAAKSGGRLAPYARLQAYLDRMHARPAYARAIERGGPYHIGQ